LQLRSKCILMKNWKVLPKCFSYQQEFFQNWRILFLDWLIFV